MDIKIRTKSKVSLIDCTRKNLGIYGRASKTLDTVVATDAGMHIDVLGAYDTEERAMEILNLIETQIEEALNKNYSGIVIQMPEK